jgi:hypothetical protein
MSYLSSFMKMCEVEVFGILMMKVGVAQRRRGFKMQQICIDASSTCSLQYCNSRSDAGGNPGINTSHLEPQGGKCSWLHSWNYISCCERPKYLSPEPAEMWPIFRRNGFSIPLNSWNPSDISWCVDLIGLSYRKYGEVLWEEPGLEFWRDLWRSSSIVDPTARREYILPVVAHTAASTSWEAGAIVWPWRRFEQFGLIGEFARPEGKIACWNVFWERRWLIEGSTYISIGIRLFLSIFWTLMTKNSL